MPQAKVTDFVVTNGATLYYERQGAGQSLLFIAGSTGDAGNFTRTAELLADEFTVVTYDRRGNSRSARPPSWTKTSVSEQADDAAGIIRALGLEPTVVFGASAGGSIALDLMIRHPRLLCAGILQEPSIFSVLPDPAAALAPRRTLIEDTLRTKGPRGAIEALMCYLNDECVLGAIPPDILERMLNNADTILSIEGPGFAGWRPRDEDVAALSVPMVLMIARDTLPVYRQVTDWLASRLKVEPIVGPGRHAFYYYRPQDLADLLRPILRRFTTK
ncbi:MAG TPA: alpha/beta hydrolase [Methylomirabilota bacterium]|nr:alpha/beta hydrolase [Methylomirabilota bacterium]